MGEDETRPQLLQPLPGGPADSAAAPLDQRFLLTYLSAARHP